MGTKHLVIIHGRDKKPRCDEMLRLIKKALIAGLRRVNEEAAQKLDRKRTRLNPSNVSEFRSPSSAGKKKKTQQEYYV
ncbi:hypothetical protein E4V51_21365, partial [Paenibacillus sp. 28ISP30-2]|nr:hypothetical protein [Paenibacillus sp. 28ISP30-2]